jgi:hypothetical protein
LLAANSALSLLAIVMAGLEAALAAVMAVDLAEEELVMSYPPVEASHDAELP